MTQREMKLHMAEQQILGFYHCYNGGDLDSLLLSMNLEKKEYDEMLKNEMLNYLPEELLEEIEDYLSKNN